MQVEVIRTYTAKQPDELSLQVADVVLVSQTVEGALALAACLTFTAHSLCVAPLTVVSILLVLHFAVSSTSFHRAPA